MGIATLMLSSLALAQAPLYTFTGSTPLEFFGNSVASAGDVNADGFDDLIIGATRNDTAGPDYGAAFVRSGKDGTILYSFFGNNTVSLFGEAVSGAGDVNGDGYDDLIVGASRDEANLTYAGSAFVFSGSDGAMLYSWSGTFLNDQFGRVVSRAGDVNGDGFDDVIVGAPETGAGSGSAYVYSGRDGALLYSWSGLITTHRMGASVSAAGDVNADGFDDVVVGVPGYGFFEGAAFVYSGLNGAILYQFLGSASFDQLGRSVGGAGDVNDDGFDDVVLAAAGIAAVYVHSGLDGSVLYTFNGGGFGQTVSGAGDVNSDGYDDVIVGTPTASPNGASSGSVSIYSGADGSELFTKSGTVADDRLGASVSSAGDVNGDGFDDVILGAPEPFASGGAGRAEVYALAPVALELAQVLAAPFSGSWAQASSVARAGDVNGDGFDDVIVGAPFDPSSSQSGSAKVHSGLDGSVLHSFVGNSAGDRFGLSVSGAGDTNGDGIDDLIIGAPYDDPNGSASGSAFVYSGLDGSLLYTFTGNTQDNEFGSSVSGAGDVNGDGFDDVIVGEYRNTFSTGKAYVFSGQNGSVLHTFTGPSFSSWFGYSVSDAGDVNSDGFDDVIVGAWLHDANGANSGSAYVYSGFDGSTLHTFTGDSANDYFGYTVSGAGDINADGFDDLVITAPFDDPNGLNSGSVRIHSGQNGSVLHTFDGYLNPGGSRSAFGDWASGAGDTNGDGFADVIVGAPQDDLNGSSSGSALVYSGADGSLLSTFFGSSAGDRFGLTVSCAGDLNGDGFDDVIVGSEDTAYVWQSTPQSDGGRAIPYGRACGASNRIARMGFSGPAKVGQTLEIKLHGAATNAPTNLFVGDSQSLPSALDPLGLPLGIIGLPDCSLHTTAIASAATTTDAIGRASFSLNIPNDPALAASGVLFMFQWVTLDVGVTPTGPPNLPLSFSDGLLLDLGL